MHGYLVCLKVGYKSFKINNKMSDDKVIFSMQKLSKTYTGADKPVLKTSI
jgi:hypothetical protein